MRFLRFAAAATALFKFLCYVMNHKVRSQHRAYYSGITYSTFAETSMRLIFFLVVREVPTVLAVANDLGTANVKCSPAASLCTKFKSENVLAIVVNAKVGTIRKHIVQVYSSHSTPRIVYRHGSLQVDFGNRIRRVGSRPWLSNFVVSGFLLKGTGRRRAGRPFRHKPILPLSISPYMIRGGGSSC